MKNHRKKNSQSKTSSSSKYSKYLVAGVIFLVFMIAVGVLYRPESNQSPVTQDTSEQEPADQETVIIKFKQGSDARLSGKRFSGNFNESKLNDIISKDIRPTKIERVFSSANNPSSESESRQNESLSLYYRLVLPENVSVMQARENLNKINVIEQAYEAESTKPKKPNDGSLIELPVIED